MISMGLTGEIAGFRTLALAFLQFVQAFGVTDSGTFRFLPWPLLVPGLARVASESADLPVEVGSVMDDDPTSSMELSEELPVAAVSERSVCRLEGSCSPAMTAHGLRREESFLFNLRWECMGAMEWNLFRWSDDIEHV